MTKDFGADPATHEPSQSTLSRPSGECPGDRLCTCCVDDDDRPLCLAQLPSGNYQIRCDECGKPVIDDDPQTWRELAEAAIMDLRRYAEDELPHRRRVSARAYERRFALLDTAQGTDGGAAQ